MRSFGVVALGLLACTYAGEPAKPDAGVDIGVVVTKTPILMHHHDGYRTGANIAETALTVENVPGRFGLLFSLPVQGQVYAQPLFVPNLDGVDVLFVATEHNDVYAFDIETTVPIWHVNLGPSSPSADFDVPKTPYKAIIPEVGITSTPVIDLDTQTIYVVAQTKEDVRHPTRVHALDLATGMERPNSPVDLVVSNGTVSVPEIYVHQRAALALAGSTLWIAGGGHGEQNPDYHGWVIAMDKTALVPSSAWLTTPSGKNSGIWMAGSGPAIDEGGDIYFQTGNGAFDETVDPPNLANSIVRLHVNAGSIELADWFSPSNNAFINSKDWDLGSTGFMLVPGTTMGVGGSKGGVLDVVKRNALGHITMDDSQAVQTFRAANPLMFVTPVYWDGETGKRIYTLAIKDSIKGFRFDGEHFDPNAFTTSKFVVPVGIPGANLAISANGRRAGTGIVWAYAQADENQYGYITGHGALHAFDADDLTHELYSSLDDLDVPAFGYVKFAVPAVTAGKVFVGTASDSVLVFGLKNQP